MSEYIRSIQLNTTGPDISVVIVNWNTRDYLLDCISSLKDQTKRAKLEIIVADNGSEDGSQDALKKAYPDVKLLENNENLGFSKANNIGIEASSGRYICLVNTDIIALDHCLDKMLAYADSHENVGMLGLRTVGRDGELRKNCRYFPTLGNAISDYFYLKYLFPGVEALEGRTMRHYRYDENRSVQVMSGCFLMVRREALDEVGLLDERFFFYGEDTDWCKRMYDKGWDRVFFTDATAIHFGGGSSRSYPVKYYLTMEKADLQYWQKHHNPITVGIYIVIKSMYHFVSGLIWSLVFPIRNSTMYRQKIAGHFSGFGWLLLGRFRKTV